LHILQDTADSILQVAAYTQAQSEQPYDTLFPLSPRQIVTSVVAALSRLFLHLLKIKRLAERERLAFILLKHS